jgi:hypothetical protein
VVTKVATVAWAVRECHLVDVSLTHASPVGERIECANTSTICRESAIVRYLFDVDILVGRQSYDRGDKFCS